MKPPIVNQRDCITALEKDGFQLRRYKGSHAVLGRGTLEVHIPKRHSIGVGLMHKILKRVGMSSEQFRQLLKAK